MKNLNQYFSEVSVLVSSNFLNVIALEGVTGYLFENIKSAQSYIIENCEYERIGDSFYISIETLRTLASRNVNFENVFNQYFININHTTLRRIIPHFLDWKVNRVGDGFRLDAFSYNNDVLSYFCSSETEAQTAANYIELKATEYRFNQSCEPCQKQIRELGETEAYNQSFKTKAALIERMKMLQGVLV